MVTCRRWNARHISKFVFAAVVLLAIIGPQAPASAQGIFNFFFSQQRTPAGPGGASAYADPSPQFNNGARPGEPTEPRLATPSPAAAYCVRLCDGRFFPIQRTGGITPAQVCSSFCPASHTKIFSGSGIDRAVASDGARYSDLPNAFVFRQRVIADCTCNGKDSFGVVNASPADDPTLRAGDIVATNSGFVAYGGGRRQNAEFTPVESYAGFSAEMRARLTGVKIIPRNASPVSLAGAPPLAASRAERRAQAAR